MNRVVYKSAKGSVVVLIPSQEVLDTAGLQAIAEKDVPQDLPYWFADAADIPADRSQRGAWEIDETMGDPDGFGGASNEFTDEQLLQLYNAGVIE